MVTDSTFPTSFSSKENVDGSKPSSAFKTNGTFPLMMPLLTEGFEGVIVTVTMWPSRVTATSPSRYGTGCSTISLASAGVLGPHLILPSFFTSGAISPCFGLTLTGWLSMPDVVEEGGGGDGVDGDVVAGA